MGVVSQYEKLMRDQYEAIPEAKKRKFDELAADNPDTKAFFDLFTTTPSKTVQASSVTRRDLMSIFGTDAGPIIEVEGNFYDESFALPDGLPLVELTDSFRTQWEDIMRHIASDDTKEALHFFGEVSATYTSPEGGMTLSGAGDYFLGYGDRSSETLENLSLIGEAKRKGWKIGDTVILQTLAYMLMVHVARKRMKKEHPRVYGFATNGLEWVFLVIGDDGKLGRSRTPKTTPTVSPEAKETELGEAEQVPYTFRIVTQHPPMKRDRDDGEYSLTIIHR
ncbi:hypothetical protein HK104_004662 [Borealophlyctis nickersoniae]|nr:hypothetical protein HK104_004662 [Borealophlyctis nickersoniae]